MTVVCTAAIPSWAHKHAHICQAETSHVCRTRAVAVVYYKIFMCGCVSVFSSTRPQQTERGGINID